MYEALAIRAKQTQTNASIAGNMNMMMQMPFYAGAYSGEETCMPVMPMPTTTEQDMSYAGGRRPSVLKFEIH